MKDDELLIDSTTQEYSIAMQINDPSIFEINVEQNIFAKALSHVQSVVDRKNIIPILSHLKLEANDGKLIITATDMDLSITETIIAEVVQEGAITLPAHTLHEIVRKFSDGTIQLKIDPNQPNLVEIRSGFSIFHLPFLKAEEFPQIEFGSFDCKFTLSHEIMQKIIEKNRYTISQEDSRYNLNGIYLHPLAEDKVMRATATDGHRLSSVKFYLPENATNMPGIIIPRKTIFELLKIIADHQQDIEIEVSAVKIRLNLGEVILISKLIDAEFPDYLGLIPTNNALFFSLASVDFAKAVDRATTIMVEKSQAIKLTIDNSQLELQAIGDHHSLANEKLEVSCNMDQFEIAFNAKYLLDITSVIANSSNVEFRFSDPFSAALVQAQDDPNTDFVLMPMRV